jgi:hypothetical protein
MSRIKPIEAMKYLGLARDSFRDWCEAVQLSFHTYEMSNRTFIISGEFYSKADKIEIKKIKERHGDKWHEFYQYSAEVIPFLDEEIDKPITNKGYKPKSANVVDFIKKLNK